MKPKLVILLSSLLLLSILLIIFNKVQDRYTDQIVMEEVVPVLPEKSTVNLEAYFPIIKDTIWTFEDESVCWIDFINEDVFQIRIKNDEEYLAKVYIQEESAIYEVATIEDATIKQDYTNFRQYKHPILKLPLEKGNTWKVEEGTIAEITQTDMKVEVPSGQVNGIEVTIKSGSSIQKLYYGENIGLVKVINKDNATRKIIELEKYEQNTPLKQQVEVYLGDSYSGKLIRKDQDLSVLTNEEPKHFLTDVLKRVSDEQYILAIPKNAIIENIYVDQDTKKLYLDMSKEYYEMNYTPRQEQMAIESLVSTVGAYYGVNRVVLTVGGEPYRSENIEYKVGESIPLELNKIEVIVR